MSQKLKTVEFHKVCQSTGCKNSSDYTEACTFFKQSTNFYYARRIDANILPPTSEELIKAGEDAFTFAMV